MMEKKSESEQEEKVSSVQILQPAFIWKKTEKDGLLPVCNFAAIGDTSKKGKAVGKSGESSV